MYIVIHNSLVKKDITLVAVWNSTKEKYTVTFNSNGGTSIATQTIEEGEKVTIPASPTKENYTFIEWQLNGNKFDFNTKIDKDDYWYDNKGNRITGSEYQSLKESKKKKYKAFQANREVALYFFEIGNRVVKRMNQK